MLMFRIKNNETGLYSKGGYNPSFTKKGKVWLGRGPFHNHLSFVGDRRIHRVYKNCIVEVLVVGETPNCTIPVLDYLDDIGYKIIS